MSDRSRPLEQRGTTPIANPDEVPDTCVAETDDATADIPIDAPGEPAVRSPSTIGMWIVVLFGPAAWIAHFMVVYLAAEASCESARTPQMSFVGEAGLDVVIVTATLVATAAIGAVGWVCRRRSAAGSAMTMYRIGVLLAALFALSTVVIGLVPLVLDPC